MNPEKILSEETVQLIRSKRGEDNQLFFGVLWIFFQNTGRFPSPEDSLLELVQNTCELLAIQTSFSQKILKLCIARRDRTLRRFKQEIRCLFNVREMSNEDKEELITYCKTTLFPKAPTLEQAAEQFSVYLKNRNFEVPSEKQLHRILTKAHHDFEIELFESINACLSSQTKKALDQLLEEAPREVSQNISLEQVTLYQLKEDGAYLNRPAILDEIRKYKHLQSLQISPAVDLLGSSKLFEKYYLRVLVEFPSHLKRHKPLIRYAYLTLFCLIRQRKMTDNLADLLLKLLHKMLMKAERFIDKALQSDNKKVTGKLGTLLVLAKTSVDCPDGIIQSTIYPKVSKDRLLEILEDLGTSENWYRDKIKSKAISLYKHNNRELVWAIMEVLTLQAGSLVDCQLLSVLKFIKKINDSNSSFKNSFCKVLPFEPIFPSQWLSLIKTKDKKEESLFSINWNACELSLFERFETELTVKNIWLKQAHRYRNPDDDLPKDFDENEDYYFDLLGLPKDPDVFIDGLKQRVDENLEALNQSILTNQKVKIYNRKKKGSIKITPFSPQKEPKNLSLLKEKISDLWPNLHLLDILKEADLRIGFSKRFQSVATHERINKQRLQKRLLLCVFGLGSNIGLKRMSGVGERQESYNNLRYVKKNYVTCQNVRFAIQDMVNAIYEIRDPILWGLITLSYAADSKKIGVWDQNLMAEWHTRYGGRGIMIYWHVDEKATCIYSSLKTCASSEVAAMINGILNHDTDVDMNQISTDTHGQSTIGFGVSELLSFLLYPRIKNINKQKLYASSKAKKDSYTNLTPALASETIHWQKIKASYREAVRHMAALKTGTVTPEVMMKRLSADNKTHSVYQALLEIGKASRTIFLCRYLSSEELRIEIHEVLNVVERVNGIMEFIFYGRLGEVSTNDTVDQELAILCLHLLQVCMVYINTLLIQTVLSDPQWINILTTEDKRALSPLFHTHINPYGIFVLNMDLRINIENHLYQGNRG